MPVFNSDGIDIAYLDEGEGEPIFLIHGFASNKRVNWDYPGWIDTLVKAGRRVIAPDNRGHGESEALYDPEAYGAHIMAEDVRRLMDHLGIERADIMGYSMGARISAFLALNHPERVRHVIFGGLGYGMVTGTGEPEPIALALEAPSLDEVVGTSGRMFRKFAEQTKSDLLALAACMRSSRKRISPEDVGRITAPALVVVGTEDTISGPAQPLADLLPKGRALELPGRDHMNAVGNKVFKQSVLEFLKEEV
ncbi:alpha/beta hydrolase [Breoghania sp.]|uniref:alpha/beta fold hydrolase n=1 Tax=Breoghania sp. TaxID=2065378 RepID=UPI0029CA298F|nr:alpha/beta hydrolase [Breoghania sp.]